MRPRHGRERGHVPEPVASEDVRRGAIVLLVAVFWALAASCARPGAPTGGPQDRRPPVLIAIEPDTFAVIEPGERDIKIRFDETISERVTGGTMDDAVLVSPLTGEVEIDHSGNELTVRIEGGFQAGQIYRVTVLPVLADRAGNEVVAPFEWAFSTGPEFEPTVLAGEVWDRITGAPVADARVFAFNRDSVPYVARTDTAGFFVMRFLPSGEYRMVGFVDRDQDAEPDPFEPQGEGGTLTLGGLDTLLTEVAMMVPDTTPPRLVQGEKVDSTTLRIIFDDHLAPEAPVEGLVRGMFRDSGDTPGVLRVLKEWEYVDWQDSLAARQAALDSVAAIDRAAAGDSTGAGAPAAPRARRPAAASDTTRRAFLPNGERVPRQSLILILRGVIEGGSDYTVLHGPVRNISGLVTEEGEGTLRLEPDPEPPSDSTAADSLAADSAAVTPPDTGAVAPPDTGGVARAATPRSGNWLPWERPRRPGTP